MLLLLVMADFLCCKFSKGNNCVKYNLLSKKGSQTCRCTLEERLKRDHNYRANIMKFCFTIFGMWQSQKLMKQIFHHNICGLKSYIQ